jgi:hypothetical protein
LIRIAATRVRGTMTSATVTSPNPSARDAISLARGSTEPVFAASSTSCWSSSFDNRASVNVVLSPKNRRNRLEDAVSSQITGRKSHDSSTIMRAVMNE